MLRLLKGKLDALNFHPNTIYSNAEFLFFDSKLEVTYLTQLVSCNVLSGFYAHRVLEDLYGNLFIEEVAILPGILDINKNKIEGPTICR